MQKQNHKNISCLSGCKRGTGFNRGTIIFIYSHISHDLVNPIYELLMFLLCLKSITYKFITYIPSIDYLLIFICVIDKYKLTVCLN